MSIMNDMIIKIIIDTCKQIISALPNAIEKWRFSKFFGSQVIAGDNIFVVLDPYQNLLHRIGQTRYIKNFLNRRSKLEIIGEDFVLGVNIVRVITYTSALFIKFRKITNPIKFVVDEEVENKWNGTFICLEAQILTLKLMILRD